MTLTNSKSNKTETSSFGFLVKPKNINILWYTEVNEMESTTIKLSLATKELLNGFKQYEKETYDEVIRKLVYVAKKVKTEPKLSQQAIKQIEEARDRMSRGEFYTHEQVMKRLGMRVRNKIR